MEEIQIKTLIDTTFIDLFAGLGGFRLALESLGSECVFSSEWDLNAQDVYETNFGERPYGDITKIHESSVPDHDILCAGFPCQAFSISGKKLGFEDSRGTLFFDVARIVKHKRPKVVFLENVKNFASHDGGNTLKVVRNTLEELGYTFSAKVLNAADYGVPQARERIYIVAIRNDALASPFSFPQKQKLSTFVEDILLENEEAVQHLYVDRSDLQIANTTQVFNSNRPIRLGIVNKGGQGERIYSPKGVAVTLSAYGGGAFAKTGGYLINGKSRKLHPRECARLMGFPEDYALSPNSNQSYRQFGNSVVVNVLQLVANQIGLALKNGDLPSPNRTEPSPLRNHHSCLPRNLFRGALVLHTLLPLALHHLDCKQCKEGKQSPLWSNHCFHRGAFQPHSKYDFDSSRSQKFPQTLDIQA